jgi:hypothetical protein
VILAKLWIMFGIVGIQNARARPILVGTLDEHNMKNISNRSRV